MLVKIIPCLSTYYYRWIVELQHWPCLQHTPLYKLCSFSSTWVLPVQVLFNCLVYYSPLISQNRKEFSIGSLFVFHISSLQFCILFCFRDWFLRHVRNTGTCVDLDFFRSQILQYPVTGLLGNVLPHFSLLPVQVKLLLDCSVSSLLLFL